MRVFVVEDESAPRSYLVLLLVRSGYAVDAVGNGADALAAITTSRPDLVLPT